MQNKLNKTRKISPKEVKNDNFEERVIKIKRVSKTTKAGRRSSFTCLVIIGNRNGVFGKGLGAGAELNIARKKAIHKAKSNLIKVPLTENKTISHPIFSKFGATSINMMPSKIGSGLKCGSSLRTLLELIGIQDAKAKIIGSRNADNVLKAGIKAFSNLFSVNFVKAFNS